MCEKNAKLALVTGATRGIGLGIALSLARNGVRVIGTATSDQGAAELGERLNEVGGAYAGHHQAIVLNLLDQESIQASLTSLFREVGYPDILVHNAGISRDRLLMRMTDEDWSQVMDVNLNSFFHLSKACIKHMVGKRWGRIIAIGSVVAQIGNKGQAQYAASKAGLEGFVRSLAKEVASRNICVNVISPGFIETDMTKALSQEYRQSLLSQIPMNRFGNAEEVSGVVEFLLSEAAGYITGAVIPVNGGLSM